ncbi:hemin uptake protein HemP [Limoniibacter endophyticus]|nr:hemin uptake protein HemP [Limoniibacter endophyticus]
MVSNDASSAHGALQPSFISSQPDRVIESRSLFAGDREIGIDHRGSIYRLRITRQGKLILNK